MLHLLCRRIVRIFAVTSIKTSPKVHKRSPQTSPGVSKTLLYFCLRSSNQKWRLQILLVRVVEKWKGDFTSLQIQQEFNLFMYQFILTVECLQWKIVNAALFTSCTLRIHFCSRPAIFLRHRKISIRTKFDWFRKLSPSSQPIRRKTQDNRDLFIRVSNALSIFLVSALSSHWLIFMKNLALIGLWNNFDFWIFYTQFMHLIGRERATRFLNQS